MIPSHLNLSTKNPVKYLLHFFSLTVANRQVSCGTLYLIVFVPLATTLGRDEVHTKSLTAAHDKTMSPSSEVRMFSGMLANL